MSRQHTSASVGGVEVHVIVIADDAALLADVEEAVKTAARNGISTARDRYRIPVPALPTATIGGPQ